MNPKFNAEAFARFGQNYSRDRGPKATSPPKKKKKRKRMPMEKEKFNIAADMSKTVFDGIFGALLMFVLSSSLVTKTVGAFVSGFYQTSVNNILIPNHIRYYYQNMETDDIRA